MEIRPDETATHDQGALIVRAANPNCSTHSMIV
jgi:hypothetical protein